MIGFGYSGALRIIKTEKTPFIEWKNIQLQFLFMSKMLVMIAFPLKVPNKNILYSGAQQHSGNNFNEWFNKSLHEMK